MVTRDSLITFIHSTFGNDILEKAAEKDLLANGVQFLGGPEVEKVTLGVSLNAEWLTAAVESGSNFCIFHHGFDPRTYNSHYSLSAQKRLKQIFTHDLTIMGFHYALDAHPVFGNNAVIAAALNATLREPLFDDWGFVAEFDTPRSVIELAEQCSDLFNHDVLAIYAESTNVKRVGIVSGAAKPYEKEIAEMKHKGVELFISGESSESVPHKMQENNIHYFLGGHYATEVFGIQALGKQIKDHFGKKIAVEFIDIPNPL